MTPWSWFPKHPNLVVERHCLQYDLDSGTPLRTFFRSVGTSLRARQAALVYAELLSAAGEVIHLLVGGSYAHV